MHHEDGAVRTWLLVGAAALVVAVVGTIVLLPSSDEPAVTGGTGSGTTTRSTLAGGVLSGERFFDLPCEPVSVRRSDSLTSAPNLLTGEGLQVDLDGGNCKLQFTGKPPVDQFSGPSTAQTRSDEAAFVALINESRAQAGLGPVTVQPNIISVAREHTEFMRERNILEHATDLPARFPPEWQALGENVGKGKNVTVQQLHDAFMNSPGHRANILDGKFNYVGLGVRYASDGTLWVTEEFMQAPPGLTEPLYPVPASEGPAVAGPANLPNTEWYFADGFTGPGFQEALEILNPGNGAASVTIDYVISGGTQQQAVSVPPRSRLTVSVNEAVGPNHEVSAILRSSAPVIAGRLMQFVYAGRWPGETTLIGSQPATSFFFAEGFTGPNFEEFLTLFNPDAQPAQATVSYQFSDGTNRDDAVALAARQRVTINVNAVVGANRELSIAVTGNRPIVVERPMYFAFNGQLEGGHTSSGSPAPATHLTFAEGYTGAGFFEYLTIQNPGEQPANVNITYLLGGGGTQPQGVTVGPRSRFTIPVHEVVPNREVSMDIVSDQPIVAERPMYFTFKGRVRGGHDVVGTQAPAQHWLFPGGDTTVGTDTYITVANPNPSPVTISVTVFDDVGQVTTRNFGIPPAARHTVDMARDFGSGRVGGVQVSASAPVVAEQPTYTLTGVNGGSDVTGFPV